MSPQPRPLRSYIYRAIITLASIGAAVYMAETGHHDGALAFFFLAVFAL